MCRVKVSFHFNIPILKPHWLTFCLRIRSLANAELCLTLASMIRRFKFELFETTIEDVKITWDNFAGGQRPESKGIRVKVIDKEV